MMAALQYSQMGSRVSELCKTERFHILGPLVGTCTKFKNCWRNLTAKTCTNVLTTFIFIFIELSVSVIVRLTCVQSSVHGHKQDAEVVYCLLLLLLLIVNIYVCNYSAEVCLIFHVDCKFPVSVWSNVHLWSVWEKDFTSLDLWMCTTKSMRFPHFGRRGGGKVCIQGVWYTFRDTLW